MALATSWLLVVSVVLVVPSGLLSTLYLLFSRKSLLATVVYGLTYSFSQSVVFFMYATIFRFGAYQVTRDDDNIAYAEFTDVFRVLMALMFGALAVGQASSFAPNYAKAKVSANRIFALLDREPLIDNYSEDGERLVSILLHIKSLVTFTLK